jgi:hypothetical protein
MIRVLLIAGWRHHNYFKTDFFNGIRRFQTFPVVTPKFKNKSLCNLQPPLCKLPGITRSGLKATVLGHCWNWSQLTRVGRGPVSARLIQVVSKRKPPPAEPWIRSNL